MFAEIECDSQARPIARKHHVSLESCRIEASGVGARQIFGITSFAYYDGYDKEVKEREAICRAYWFACAVTF